MKRILLLLACLAGLTFTGCADTYLLPATDQEGIKLDPEKSIYISSPEDGRYGSIRYLNSGTMVARILQAEFVKYSTSVDIGDRVQTFKGSLRQASEKGHGYLCFPTILEWEDRGSRWSGARDTVSVKITVVDLLSQETVRDVVITGKSGFGFFTGEYPQDLLPEPVEEFVSSMYEDDK